MVRVLVTGGTGFIGQHLVRRLLERGDEVRCLVRSLPTADRRLSRVEYASGDLTSPATLDAATSGIDVVFHLAGALLPLQPSDFWRVNAEGTRDLAEACARQQRPPVFVYVSSLAAAGPTELDAPLVESMTPRPVSLYGQSKLGGEEYLRTLAPRLPATVLRPPAVIGPGDHYTIKMFRLARRGLALVPGRHLFQMSWIYVTDLVEAMLLAAERGQRLVPSGASHNRGQGVYFVAIDEHPLVSEATRLVAQVQGRSSVRVIHMPASLCRFGAWVNDRRARLTRRGYWVNTDKMREALAGSWTCNPTKAKSELGFVCRTGLSDGFRLTYEWYRDQGWL
jgi:nucleoside-diphosphate-sugar epimerase